MTDDRLIPLELTLDDLCWLRAFLNQERGAAEVDRQKARDLLHTSLATLAAVQVLTREIETMSTIIDEICRLIDANDAHESRARKAAATLHEQPLVG